MAPKLLFAGSLAAVLACTVATRPAISQQTTVSPRLGGVGSEFSEQIGVGWRFQGPRVQAGFGPMDGPANGFSLRGSAGPLQFNLFGGQGSSRQLSSQAGSVTTLNGRPGYFFAGQQRPFVTGLVPVVGGVPGIVPLGNGAAGQGAIAVPVRNQAAAGPLEDRLERLRAEGTDVGQPRSAAQRDAARKTETQAQARTPAEGNASSPAGTLRLGAAQGSSADHAAPGLAEIRRRQQLDDEAQQREALEHFQRGLQAEQEGKPGVARYYYNLALRHDNGSLESRITRQIAVLEHGESSAAVQGEQ